MSANHLAHAQSFSLSMIVEQQLTHKLLTPLSSTLLRDEG